MKTLIYLVACGSPLYAEMAHVCIDSLRGKGRYPGDIVVITDGSFEPAPAQRVLTVRVPVASNRFETLMTKLRHAHRVDVSAWDRVLVTDTDVVAISDLAPLFEHCEGCVSAAEEAPFHTLATACMGDALTSEEREAGKDVYGLNGGIVGMDARLFPTVMAQWSAAVADYRPRSNRYVDQPAFNALVARRQIPFRAYPRGWVEFPPLYPPYGMETQISPAAKLLHFVGGDKADALSDMRGAEALLASLARGETDSTRLKGRDLFFLHQQIKNWKEEAAVQSRIAEERKAWIKSLEEANAFFRTQTELWEREAAEKARACDQLRAEADHQRTQAGNWEKEAAFQKGQQEQWQREAAYHSQQARNWEHETRQLLRLEEQRAAAVKSKPDDSSGKEPLVEGARNPAS